jgi:hypothetical protein
VSLVVERHSFRHALHFLLEHNLLTPTLAAALEHTIRALQAHPTHCDAVLGPQLLRVVRTDRHEKTPLILLYTVGAQDEIILEDLILKKEL